MSSRSLADITQKQWIRACKKLNLIVETKHGKGSHVLVKNPTTGEKYTIQKSLHKIINKKIFKILRSWGVSEDDIWNALH